MTSTVPVAQQAAAFGVTLEPFPRLHLELRLMVWTIATCEPRAVTIEIADKDLDPYDAELGYDLASYSTLLHALHGT